MRWWRALWLPYFSRSLKNTVSPPHLGCIVVRPGRASTLLEPFAPGDVGQVSLIAQKV
jgi:hypothetical protein